jgi:hypothetical protein
MIVSRLDELFFFLCCIDVYRRGVDAENESLIRKEGLLVSQKKKNRQMKKNANARGMKKNSRVNSSTLILADMLAFSHPMKG